MFKGLKIMVIGAGLSGRSAARWLACAGADVTISDTKPLDQWDQQGLVELEACGVRLEAGGHSQEKVGHSDMVVVSPGVPLDSPPVAAALQNKVPVCGDLCLATALWKGPIIAITGTNGKTTTTMLTYRMLESSGIPCVCGGNIGIPLFDLFDENDEKCVAVLEVSSFQLDYFMPTPLFDLPIFTSATVLNLAPDHMDRYLSLDFYRRSKARIFDMLGKEGLALLPAREKTSLWISKGPGPNLAYFGRRKSEAAHSCGCFFDQDNRELFVRFPHQDEIFYSLKQWRPKGLHNLENLSAAVALASWNNASQRGIQQVIDTFEAPQHRLQFVAEINGIQFYNDSKATNVAAACCAIKSLEQPGILIAGGSSKGEDFTNLGKAAEASMIKAVVLMGQEAERIEKALPSSIKVVRVKTNGNGVKAMEAAANKALSLAQPGDLVLLSPACASFDLYENYAERGNVFKQVVEALKG